MGSSIFFTSSFRIPNMSKFSPRVGQEMNPLDLEMGELDGIYCAGHRDIIGIIKGQNLTVTFQDAHQVTYDLVVGEWNGQMGIHAKLNNSSHYYVAACARGKDGLQISMKDIRQKAKKRSFGRVYRWTPAGDDNRQVKVALGQLKPICNPKGFRVRKEQNKINSDLAEIASINSRTRERNVSGRFGRFLSHNSSPERSSPPRSFSASPRTERATSWRSAGSSRALRFANRCNF